MRAALSVTSRHVEREGARLVWRERGAGPTTVVCLPGLGLDGAVFDRLAELLSGRCRLVLPDPRGTGRSAAPRGPYSFATLVDDAASVVEAIGGAAVTLLGHSLGAAVALGLTLRRPAAVRALVLLGATARFDGAALGPGGRVLTGIGAPPARSVEEAVLACLGPTVRADTDRLTELLTERAAHPPNGRGLRGQLAAARQVDLRDRLHEVGAPALVIHGADDPVWPAARGRELAAALPRARYVELPGIGHLPQLEAPDLVAAEVAALLAP